MNDVVILEAIRSGFWLAVIAILVFVFRREIKLLLQSLGSFKVAGATFELRDRKETLQSYVLLAETLIDILSRGERNDVLLQVVHPSQIEKLGAFALKYTEEVGDTQWNEELLRNIAYLLLRHGRHAQSVQLYNGLLIRRPDHADLLNLKALALMTSRLDVNVKEAKAILISLSNRFPEDVVIRSNLMLSYSLLRDHDEVAKLLVILTGLEYYKYLPNLLEDPLLHYTREERPDLIDQFRKQVLQLQSTSSSG